MNWKINEFAANPDRGCRRWFDLQPVGELSNYRDTIATDQGAHIRVIYAGSGPYIEARDIHDTVAHKVSMNKKGYIRWWRHLDPFVINPARGKRVARADLGDGFRL